MRYFSLVSFSAFATSISGLQFRELERLSMMVCFTFSSEISQNTTERPAPANERITPFPVVPAPNTPTLLSLIFLVPSHKEFRLAVFARPLPRADNECIRPPEATSDSP